MASTLAHEVNQPLAVATNFINASASLLRKRGEGCCEDVLAMIEEASQETLKAGEIVRRMRNFIVSGKICGRREDIGKMIERAVEALACTDGADIEIDYGFGPNARFVIAERVQIEQVLSNLLRNACEAVSGSAISPYHDPHPARWRRGPGSDPR
jgi:two-component system sensor kinase FixL